MTNEDFETPPEIPPEIWKELAKLQAFQNALTRASLAIISGPPRDPHSRTLKSVEDQLKEREIKMNSFFEIEEELRKRRVQEDSVCGKDTPFRVEFRYPQGTRHYQYFATIDDAIKADDAECGYTPLGEGFVRKPLSRQVQVRGTRGGWHNA